MTSQIAATSRSPAANATVLLLLATYLAAVVWRGNIGAFATAVWNDFSGQGSSTVGPGGAVTVTGTGGVAFWQWALALVILYALAENNTTAPLFEPLLAIMIVAMLLQLAIKQPQVFKKLTQGINSIFGGT